MKNIIILLGLFVIFQLQAAVDVNCKANVNRATYTGVATDTINGTTTADAIFFIEYAAKGKYQLSFFISGDTLNGCSGNVTIQAYGSYDDGTYSTVGSAITWTTTADYDANTTLNTYTTLASGTQTNAQHTETTAAFNITGNAAGNDTLLYADTLIVPQQTTTVAAQTITDARTVTVTTLGVDYPYIKILLTGASGARVELQKVVIKVTPLNGKLD